MADEPTDPQDRLRWLATCGFGLESVVRGELARLGLEPRVVGNGQVAFESGWEGVCRGNLWLRTADRVVAEIGRFPCADFDSLFEHTRALPWERWIGPEDAAIVSGHSVGSTLASVPACQRAVKKAIVQRLSTAHGVSVLPEVGVPYRVHLGLVNDEALLTIDSTGPSLHRRGYRTKYQRTWLKETLAAAMVILSGWTRDRPFIDPFCGSGTIPIEAAMIGCRIAPGRNRTFAAEAWPQIDRELWEAARREADEQQLDDLPQRIVAMDIDERVLKLARRDAEQAGVEDSIHFQPAPLSRMQSKRRGGWVITNPPWFQTPDGRGDGAVRGGQPSRELQELYVSIPVAFRNLPTWSFNVLTDYPRFESLIGRTADRRRKLYNDRTQCTLYQFLGPADQRPTREAAPSTSAADDEDRPPAARPALPAFGALGAKADEQAELFRRRLDKRAKHLRRWPTRQGITCFRLYERDIPEIPLVVDRYEDSLHISEYERPHDRDPAAHANWLDLMARTAAETLEIAPSRVFLKRRQRQRGNLQHQRIGQTGREFVVGEGGLKFIVNLSDYVDTGLFLDHRITRGMVRDEARGKRFLNLFAYTGAFTVYAADGGASSTTTVDLSAAYLQWAERNMAENGFKGAEHQFVRSDAMQYLQSLAPGDQFDLAVVDPPTFSNSKRTEQDWEVQSGYAELLNKLLDHMPVGGVVYFSNNFRRFKFDPERIQAAQVHEISNQTVPPDFRNRRIHRCWRIVR